MLTLLTNIQPISSNFFTSSSLPILSQFSSKLPVIQTFFQVNIEFQLIAFLSKYFIFKILVNSFRILLCALFLKYFKIFFAISGHTSFKPSKSSKEYEKFNKSSFDKNNVEITFAVFFHTHSIHKAVKTLEIS
ncbi:MAG: hypothetical protein LBU14_04110 [Candidatus Peribacteria bacterium]|nr:hypothetical protein [Candidatus Peribacteria bacterium]